MAGLEGEEGPRPDGQLPRARRGDGPATVLAVRAPSAGAYQVFWEARSGAAPQTVAVRVDGHWLADVPVPGDSDSFAECTVPVWLTKGDHQLELRYADPQPLQAAAAVLFRALRIDPAP